MNYPTITSLQLDQMLDDNIDFQLVDLRNRPSFQKVHIKSAINIPFQELEYHIDSLDQGKPIVMYCSRGGQSMLACNRLSSRGYQVINMAAGLNYYRGKYLIRA